MRRRIISIIQWFIYMLILITMVLAAVCGYKAGVVNQNSNNDSRRELSYISNKIHEMDITGAVTLRDDEYGDMLVLTDKTEEGVYETRIYKYEGKLLEEYSSIEEPINPDKAQMISETEEFSVTFQNQIITVMTDSGKSYIKLRSERKT